MKVYSINKIKSILNSNKDCILLFIILFFVYAYIYWFCNSDLGQHVIIAHKKYEEDCLFSGNFLLYFLIHVFSFFTGIWGLMKLSLCALLAFATTWRYWLVKQNFRKEQIDSVKSTILSISLLFVFIIPIYILKGSIILSNWYLDYYVPNIWHNSTTIFLFPFALLLYFRSLEILRGKIDKLIIGQMIILVLCNVFIKPSFFFIFCVAYPILLLHKYKFSRYFFQGLIPILFGGVFLIIVYLTIYSNASDGSYVYLDFQTIFTYEFWQSRLGYILCSLLFPLLIYIVYRQKVIHDYEFWMCLLMLFCAIGIFLICKEGGPRATHGNFYWQIVISLWLCFYYGLKTIVKELIYNKRPKDIICLSIYSIHVLFGILYLFRYLFIHQYA